MMGLPHSSQFLRLSQHCTICRRSMLPESTTCETGRAGEDTAHQGQTQGDHQETHTEGPETIRKTQHKRPRSNERLRTLRKN